MVLRALGSLSSAAVRALARNLFPGFWDRGISANTALDELRDAGLGYRRQDFLRDFREGRSTFDDYTRVRFVNLGNVPTEGILEGKYFGTPDRYSFVFRAQGYDALTGEEDERHFFYHRNSLKTRGEMEEEALEWYNSQSGIYGFDGVSVQVREGYINPVWA